MRTVSVRRRLRSILVVGTLALLAALPASAVPGPALAAPAMPALGHGAGLSDLGPDVFVFTPSTPQSQIQATVDMVAGQSVPNQFGAQRFALLFEPGTYGSAAAPLIFQVGYYTTVAGLGASPNDVVINGAIDVFNQCDSGGSCTALVNFWRSVSNLTIDVTLPATPPAYSPAPPDSPSCANTGEMWATSQAAPLRRVHVNGFTTFMDYCSGPSFSSGAFVADSRFSNSSILNGSQQQFVIRNSDIDSWSNGVWNQVFSGDTGNVPAQSFSDTPSEAGGPQPYTVLPTSPVTREAPFLVADSGGGNLRVFVPALRRNSAGSTWANGATAGSSLPISRFFVASPSDSTARLNAALRSGRGLILTPGIYHLDRSLQVTRPDTVVLGLGMATLVPDHGVVAMRVGDVPGVKLSGLLFDAGATSSPALLQVGTAHGRSRRGASSSDDPTMIQDVFFRIGGAGVGRAATSLLVESNDVVIDDIWAWRADHGTGVGWTTNTAATGLAVEGANVTAYGLFVEHFQQFNVIWNGEGGQAIFFQNELPYDPPNQAAYTHDGVLGFAAFKVGSSVTSFQGWGLGAYCFFEVDPTIHASRAFEVPITPGVNLHDILTVSLGGVGTIDHVVNDFGAAAQGANTVPVNVVSYPPES